MPQRNPNNQDDYKTKQSSFLPSPPTSYAQRYASRIRNPASRLTGRAARDIRRDAFFSRIRQNRENSMFSAREDGILWTEYIRQKRQFEEEMARSAPEIGNVEDEMVDISEDANLKQENGLRETEQDWDDEAALEEYLAQEREYEAFLEETERQLEMDRMQSSQGDEDDYEKIFVDIVSNYESGVSESNQQMDLSHG
ncbi:hypothetical protein PRK78_000633 [Emydomyces testavorans]|uniref:Uncharacterized protein n=1 Tax=Emydomyces testavorans TaxID=2070801 RepID=A0AAF0DBT2_9EURO|nr:hypothetical protein PRK78_000633 [Emydomyces testavorans]